MEHFACEWQALCHSGFDNAAAAAVVVVVADDAVEAPADVPAIMERKTTHLAWMVGDMQHFQQRRS